VGPLVGQFLKPAVVGVLVGVVVGLTPLAKALLVPIETAPLGWLFGGIQTIGAAAVPLNLILLGATLSKGPSWEQITIGTNLAIVLAKMVLMPLLAAVFVIGAARVIPLDVHIRDALWLVGLVVSFFFFFFLGKGLSHWLQQQQQQYTEVIWRLLFILLNVGICGALWLVVRIL